MAGVSRSGNQPANAIFKKLRAGGIEAVPVNPNTAEIDGERCYARLHDAPQPIDAVVVVPHPAISADVVREAAELGVRKVWFHRSFGDGSVSAGALEECRLRGIRPSVGGCPLMYCRPVDPPHACFRWWLRLQHRVP